MSTINWATRLKETLSEKAVSHFQTTDISLSDFAKFIKRTTHIEDWENDFMEDMYKRYLRRKVDYGGYALAARLAS